MRVCGVAVSCQGLSFRRRIARKRLSFAHARTLKMATDVLAVKYSPNQKLLAVALLDATVKVGKRGFLG